MNDSLENKHMDHTGGYSKAAKVLRIVGPVLIAVGGLCLLSGVAGLLFVGPAMILLFFIGGPILMLGFTLTAFGFMGMVMRFQAEQVAPVGKDVFNYMAEGTQEGVKTSTRAMATGLREGLAGQPLIGIGMTPPQMGAGAIVKCDKCGTNNQAGSKFCDQCGSALVGVCRRCGADNQSGSKFCDQCGKPLDEVKT